MKESHSRKPSAVAVPVSASTPSDVIAVSTKTAAATAAMPVAVMVNAVPDGYIPYVFALQNLVKPNHSSHACIYKQVIQSCYCGNAFAKRFRFIVIISVAFLSPFC